MSQPLKYGYFSGPYLYIYVPMCIYLWYASMSPAYRTCTISRMPVEHICVCVCVFVCVCICVCVCVA